MVSDIFKSKVKVALKATVILFDNKPAAKTPGQKRSGSTTTAPTSATRFKNPLKLSDLQEFITCYHSFNRHRRVETFHAVDNTNSAVGTSPEGRWRKFGYDEIYYLYKIGDKCKTLQGICIY